MLKKFFLTIAMVALLTTSCIVPVAQTPVSTTESPKANEAETPEQKTNSPTVTVSSKPADVV